MNFGFKERLRIGTGKRGFHPLLASIASGFFGTPETDGLYPTVLGHEYAIRPAVDDWGRGRFRGSRVEKERPGRVDRASMQCGSRPDEPGRVAIRASCPDR
jgi:hypothetical protein